MIPSSAEGLAAFDQVLLDALSLFRPPEKLDMDQWADKYFFLSAEGSAQPGKWYTSSAEYQREPLRALSSTCWQCVVLMWASQVGKTAIGLIATGFFAHQDPSPMLLVQPTEDMGKTVIKDRIDPMIRDTPVLRGLFRKVRNQEWNHKAFPGGQLSMGWANSPAQLASRAVRFLWTDEEGRYGQNNEGDPVEQGRKRLATYKDRRKHLGTSSPALRKTCRITKSYGNSDQRRFYVPCPECEHMQTLRWDQLKYLRASFEPDNYQLTDCWYECEACEHHITEADKYAMIRAGEWRAENPGGGDGKTAGFHLNSLYSTIGYEWEEIVQDFLKCKGIPDLVQVFTNTVLAEPWDEQAEGADMSEIQKRAEAYPAQAPSWAIVFTVGADVQKDRIEATRVGWGLNNVAGVIEHRVFRGNTALSRSGAWLEFDAWRRLRVEHESGLELPTACTFIDSGDGNRTQAVYEYCRWRESEKVYACKGSSTAGAPLVDEPKRRGRTNTLLAMVGSSTAKDTLFSRLQIVDPAAAGYIHFPASLESGCGPEYFAQLTGEALVTRQTKGGATSKWEKQRARNEALDCFVYALAAFLLTRAPMRALAAKLEARAAKLTAEEKTRWASRVADGAMQLQEILRTPGITVGEAKSKINELIARPRVKEFNTPIKSSKKRRKVISRPGFSWIQGS